MKKPSFAIIHSPYLFALLVGLHPPLFYISNNWFMFNSWLGLFIVGIVALTAQGLISATFITASLLFRRIFPGSSEAIVRRILVFTGALTWAFLMRITLLDLLSENMKLFFLVAVMLGGVLAFFVEKFRLFRLNTALVVLCLTSLTMTMLSVLTTDTQDMSDSLDPAISQEEIDRWVFAERRNVYFIVPDAYPNREALEKIFDMNNEDFYRRLESWGFTLTHSAFSNYISTLASVSATFGMGHHYYRPFVGNFEALGARTLISGLHNPTMSAFRNNGYRISLIQQTDYLLKGGCFVDECSPSIFWGDAMRMLLPFSVIDNFDLMPDQTIEGFEERIVQHLEQATRASDPQFTYLHFLAPGHSTWRMQTEEQLLTFQKEFIPKVRSANALMERLIQFIVKHDPDALIILNADHGGFGLGWGRNRNRFQDVPETLISLDYMGVLLAIRWPEPPYADAPEIRSNVNLFRHVLAFLSNDIDILNSRVPDHAYLNGSEGSVVKVMHDGKLLKEFEEIPAARYSQ